MRGNLTVNAVDHEVVLGGLVGHQGTVGWEVLESDELKGSHDLLHLVQGRPLSKKMRMKAQLRDPASSIKQARHSLLPAVS